MNPFERIGVEPEPGPREGAAAEQARRSLEREAELAHLEKLHRFSPEAVLLLTALEDPRLPREAFFAKIEAYNEAHAAIPTEGPYKEFTVAPSPSRSVIVRVHENGRVELKGFAMLEH